MIARPIGGALSDRIPPKFVVLTSLAGTVVMAVVAAFQPPPDFWAAVTFITLAVFLGIGTGGVFAWVARRSPAASVGSTWNDKLMYAVLLAAIVAGLATTLLGSGVVGEESNYRETVSPWFRSIWILQPRGDLMAQASLAFHIHVAIAMVLFALWPFTRLVHAFSAPVAYLFRPYIVYRSRDVARNGELIGSQPHRRGW
ncbi:nitrate reductase gamma subunit [Rhodococcus wratislaviensis NBRC 100605]|uniref:Nitrate reductase gamma subunit n=1 Tax=Rhodococcus wratislaviensis NBRC 100605 TaxID=1219028 RepID=X0R4G5_RHOWR|nr:nitrate reductase gamma subunit [Rhodococcus wratislaviensis NBRC 100605]